MNDKTVPVPDTTPDRAAAKMVDFRLPLYWLISGAIAVLWSLISMYFSLQQIKSDMTELRAAAVVTAAATSEMALLKFRITSIENDVNQLKTRGAK